MGKPRVEIECFWGGDKCVPGTNVACVDCRDGQGHVMKPIMSIHGADKMPRKTLNALLKAGKCAVDKFTERRV